MKKKHVALATSLAALAVGALTLLSSAQSRVWLSTTSPSKTYTFQLTGSAHRPDVPGVENEARFDLLRAGRRVVANAYVDSYDWFDSDFGGMYPQHEWVNETTLRFAYKLPESEQSPDSLAISNATDKSVPYLKVTAGDMLFLFDVPPHSTAELPVPHQGWLSWVAAEGLFADGQPIPFNGVNFFHRDRLNIPLRYCLTVVGTNVRIASTVMDGYNGNATPERPNAPKVARCDSKVTRP